MTLTFNIVEGEPEDYWENYEEFLRLYNENTMPVKRIKEKLNLNETKYNQYRKRAIEENRLESRYNVYTKRGSYTPATYCHQTAYNTFSVQKYMNGKSVSFGTYKNKRTAKKVVEKLKECNWDKNELPRIKREVGV